MTVKDGSNTQKAKHKSFGSHCHFHDNLVHCLAHNESHSYSSWFNISITFVLIICDCQFFLCIFFEAVETVEFGHNRGIHHRPIPPKTQISFILFQLVPSSLSMRRWWAEMGWIVTRRSSGVRMLLQPSNTHLHHCFAWNVIIPIWHAGIIAVVIFTILCTLVFLVRHMFRHKGSYHTNEAKGAESADCADAAIIVNDPAFTETIDESKKEWFI